MTRPSPIPIIHTPLGRGVPLLGRKGCFSLEQCRASRRTGRAATGETPPAPAPATAAGERPGQAQQGRTEVISLTAKQPNEVRPRPLEPGRKRVTRPDRKPHAAGRPGLLRPRAACDSPMEE